MQAGDVREFRGHLSNVLRTRVDEGSGGSQPEAGAFAAFCLLYLALGPDHFNDRVLILTHLDLVGR